VVKILPETETAKAMNLEMRQKLAREPFEEKIRKVGQLIRLAKTFPRRFSHPTPPSKATASNYRKNQLTEE
jgi:hypothetical protein